MKVLEDVGALGAFVVAIVVADYAVAWFATHVERWARECKEHAERN